MERVRIGRCRQPLIDCGTALQRRVHRVAQIEAEFEQIIRERAVSVLVPS
tara:strand:+ start:4128 stop:4277 length:150 start_codon:yes stop_codon:yes gene_type:complete